MAKKTYIGVNGVARNVKNIYIGVNGVAREVKAGWIGVNGVARQFYAAGWIRGNGIARQFYAADWFIPAGLTMANVICAYQFIHASSEAIALTDQSDGGKNLIKRGAPIWNASYGFDFPNDGWSQGSTSYLHQLDNENVRWFEDAVIRYSDGRRDIPYPDNSGRGNGCPLFAISASRYFWLRTSARDTSIMTNDYMTGYNAGGNKLRCLASGVIGYKPSQSKVYHNGTPIQHDATGVEQLHNNKFCLIGQGLTWGSNDDRRWYNHGYRIQAAVFYNVALSDSQHAEMVTKINSL